MESRSLVGDTERAMSEENMEIARRYLAAYDSGGLDAVAEFWHPDIEWRAVEGYLDDVGLIRGPDELRQYYRQWEETFDAGRTEIEELTEAGDEVVALLRGVGRMKGSDAEIDIRYAVVISIRDGKIASGREYSTHQEALEAAGLSE
jgi:ketosteroid isomerase-like protein